MLARLAWGAVLAAAALSQDYSGTEVCQACHEDIAKAFLKGNPHRTLNAAGAWEAKACESCHGNGAKHSESADPKLARNPAKAAVREADQSCLGCHARQSTHAGRIVNGHGRQQVSCASCHSVHKPAPPPATQCGSCHATEKLSFSKPHAHPVSRGAMQCTDCHNPHGSAASKATNMAIGGEPGCLRCHGDKRGPFRYEHAPMRAEGCAACHEPHGSVNPRMLTRPNVAQSCLECHSSLTGGFGGVPPAFHDLRSPRYQNCTTCHTKIHGSHVNRSFLR